MKCPKCKVEAVVIEARTFSKNGNVFSEQKVKCPKCKQKGEITTLIGPEIKETSK